MLATWVFFRDKNQKGSGIKITFHIITIEIPQCDEKLANKKFPKYNAISVEMHGFFLKDKYVNKAKRESKVNYINFVNNPKKMF